MFAIVTTPRHVLLVDLQAREVFSIETKRQEYYGVSWFRDRGGLVLSHSGVAHDDVADLADYATSEVGFVSHRGTQSPSFLSVPHQILCASDGRIVCTNTGRNCITAIDLALPGRYHEAQVSARRWDRLSRVDTAGDHLNSLFEKNGRLYVLAHRFGRGSVVATFEYPSLELVAIEEAGSRSGLHNIFVDDDGTRIACDSERGGLVELRSDDVIWECGSASHTRGLAVTDDVLLVGDSVRTASRADRTIGPSGVYVVDRHSLRTLDYVPLGDFGAVHEIRVIDLPDHAHHGCVLPDASSLLARVRNAAPVEPVIERSSLRSDRLARASNSADSLARWRAFTIYGPTRVVDARGSREAPANLIALAVAPSSCDAIEFDYVLDDRAQDAHVAAVVGYEGAGDDRSMHAFLVRSNESTTFLTTLRHDGDSWIASNEIAAVDLPRAGTIRLARSADRVLVSIDGVERIALSRVLLPWSSGPLGVRWIGARVGPPRT